MTRIALNIEYLGTKFHGWQSQKNVLTVQAVVEQALAKVANEPIKIMCAGRTDSGVHATHQVIHFETLANRKIEAWVLGTNTYLPSSISVQWAKQVDDSFHARFSALSRRYQYIIYNYPVRSSFLSPLTAQVSQPLNEQSMHLAAQALIGEHDFTSFRSAECQSKTPNRYIFAIHVTRERALIKIDIVANSFLHHMVRNIVGVLIDIGAKRKTREWCKELLMEKNSNLLSRMAPSQGLYLAGVRYADAYELPSHFNPPLITGAP